MAPNLSEVYKTFSSRVYAEGQSKQLITVAVAHVTQYFYYIRGHTSAALKQEAVAEELMEAI